jgi:dipeptidyl-peptidase III
VYSCSWYLSFTFLVAACSSAHQPPALPSPESHRTARKTNVLGEVGDITVASYPPTGFDKLPQEKRILAYHLVAAAMAGDVIFTMQRSRWALPIRELVANLLVHKDNLSPSLQAQLQIFRRMVFVNHGLYRAYTGRKMTPPFSREDLENAGRVAGLTIAPDIMAALFDPLVAPVLTNRTPGSNKDPIVESAANHYQGLTSKDLVGFNEKYHLNGRVVKQNGKVVEQVYRAGGEGAPAGIAAAELGRVIKHLEAAVPLASAEQREALGHLIRYFKTGDGEEFKKHDIVWLKQIFGVDYVLGFVETYTDVRDSKGGFEGLVAIPDPERDPPLQALAKNAQFFEQKMPWQNQWKRNSFRVPAAAAVIVLGATGDAGPITALGLNLPNALDLREKYGSKNFVVMSSEDVREDLVGNKTIDEFAPEEARAELHRCAHYLEYAATALHEIMGHGSGKVDPALAAPPERVLAPFYSTVEEGRAERVADYLTGDPKVVEIGLLPDAGCARIYPQYKTMSIFVNLKFVPDGDTAEDDSMRADLVSLGILREKNLVLVEVRHGKTFLVVKNPDAWRRATGEMLAEFQRIKATGDSPALRALVGRWGTKIDTKWRDEVLVRVKALSLPQSIALIPPTLTAIRDGSGRVIDARAEQTTSLDAYIDHLERTAAE